jgi:hypothetical protein
VINNDVNKSAVLAAYKAGTPVGIIAAEHGCSPAKVCRIAQAKGLHRRGSSLEKGGYPDNKTRADGKYRSRSPDISYSRLKHAVDTGCDNFWKRRGFAPGTYPDAVAFNTFDCKGGKEPTI